MIATEFPPYYGGNPCKALGLSNPSKVKTTLTERGLISLNVRELDNTLTISEGILKKKRSVCF